MFFFRNISMSTFSESKLARWAVKMSPAVLKTRSEGTLVAGTHKYLRASTANSGKLLSCSLHQISGSRSKLNKSDFRYWHISSLARSSPDGTAVVGFAG
jgi:hypothetical protein